MPQELTIIFELGQDGWWIATIPEVPGAFSQGRAMAELMAARRELALKERTPQSEVETVPIAG